MVSKQMLTYSSVNINYLFILLNLYFHLELLNPESSKAVSSSKNVNAKKSQWDDDEDEEDMRDSYV